MRVFVFSCLLLLFSSSYAQKDTLNQLDAKGKKTGYWKKVENGKLIYEGRFLNDRPTGTFKYYYPDGKLKSETTFLKGTEKVYTVIYHPNQKIASQGIYLDQQRDSIWNYFNDKGMLLETVTLKKGIKSGGRKIYNKDNGQLICEENYKNDTLDGAKKLWYESGDLYLVSNYKKGILDGAYEIYHEGQKPYVKGTYANNNKVKIWSYYTTTGELRKIEDFTKNPKYPEITLVFMSNGKPVKFKMEDFAYFMQKDGSTMDIYTRDGNKHVVKGNLGDVTTYLHVLFCPITEKILATRSAIASHKKISSNEVQVFLKPALPFDIILEGEQAQLFLLFMNQEAPKE